MPNIRRDRHPVELWAMALYYKPHTEEWFQALAAVNADQAIQTRMIVATAGRVDVWGVWR